MDKLVSIIIVNYNGKTHLEKCLDSLKKIDYDNFEVILVDNHSTDKSTEFVKVEHPDVNIIELEKNLGFAEPNNIGARKAKGEYLLFLNNDTTVTPDFLYELIKPFSTDPRIVMCQSLLLQPDGSVDSSGDFVDVLGRAYSSKEKPETMKNILSARGACMIIKKNIFWDLRGFDKKFFASFEDVDIGWRAWIWGYRVVLAPESIVYHEGGKTVQKLSSQIQFHGVKNTICLRLVNFEATRAISSIVKSFIYMFLKKSIGISVLRDLDEPQPLPSFRIITSGLWWIVKNWRFILAKRKELNSKRVKSTANLIEESLIIKL